MPFTTTALVKAALVIPAGITQHDTQIGDCVAASNAFILREIRLAGMTEQTYTEVYDIEDEATTQILLDRRPVQSVTSVLNDTSTVDAADYYVNRNGRLRLKSLSASFCVGIQKVTVTYRAGFTNSDTLPPPDLSRAATAIAAAMFNRDSHAGLKQNEVADFVVGIDPNFIPPTAEMVLQHYRMPFPARGNAA